MDIFFSRFSAGVLRSVDGHLTVYECKTLKTTVDWTRLSAFISKHYTLCKSYTVQDLVWVIRGELQWGSRAPFTLQSLLRIIRDTVRALGKAGIVKTKTSLHYLQLVAMRPLLDVQAALRRELARTAPVDRFVLRDRTRQIFASHPPVAPPYSAGESS